jgi:exodeoxyribonuclease-3
MKIVALNIRHGGGARMERIAAWLDDHTADVLVLGEFRDNAVGSALRARLGARGWHMASAGVAPGVNGVLVASRRPMEAAGLTPDEATTGAMLLATLDDGTQVLGAYFPNMRAKPPFFARCLQVARTRGETPFLLVGDLNTGCNVRDVQPGATRFLCAEAFAALESECGLADLWRRSHGDDAREWTWLSHAGNGYRLDHAFANAAFEARHGPATMRYAHDTRETSLSDHSGLVVQAG